MSWSNGELRSDYDEDKALNEYISRNLVQLVSKSEATGYYLALKRERLKHNPEETEFLEKGVAGEPSEVFSLAELGANSIFSGIKSRIYTGQIPVNRCPNCNRIVRTPKALQCLWCGRDWHHIGPTR